MSATWQREGGGGAEAGRAELRSAAGPPEPLDHAAEVDGCGEEDLVLQRLEWRIEALSDLLHCRICTPYQESSGQR